MLRTAVCVPLCTAHVKVFLRLALRLLRCALGNTHYFCTADMGQRRKATDEPWNLQCRVCGLYSGPRTVPIGSSSLFGSDRAGIVQICLCNAETIRCLFGFVPNDLKLENPCVGFLGKQWTCSVHE